MIGELLCFPRQLACALADGIQLGLQVIGWGEPAWPDSLLTSAAPVEVDGVVAPRYGAAERPAPSAPSAGGAGHPTHIRHFDLASPTVGQYVLAEAANLLDSYADGGKCLDPEHVRKIAAHLDEQSGATSSTQ